MVLLLSWPYRSSCISCCALLLLQFDLQQAHVKTWTMLLVLLLLLR